MTEGGRTGDMHSFLEAAPGGVTFTVSLAPLSQGKGIMDMDMAGYKKKFGRRIGGISKLRTNHPRIGEGG